MSAFASLSPRPIVAFTGPFGSGKTEVAINYCRLARRRGKVCLVDLDVVTPYFRAGDYRALLEGEEILVVAAPGALASFELPALPPQIAGALLSPDLHTVLDVGGDPVGAQLLRVYARHLIDRGHDLWMVVNPYRPGATDPGSLIGHARAIETASGLRLTGLLADPHVGVRTEPHEVEAGLAVVREAAEQLRLPVVAVALAEGLAGQVAVDLPILPLRLTVRPSWEAPR